MSGDADNGTVRVERIANVAVVTLDYPERRNAISLKLREKLIDQMNALMADAETRVIVITGAGEHFSSGGELSSMDGMTAIAARERLLRLQRLIRTIVTGKKPVIAAVEGWTVGAAVSVVAACDVVVAARNSRFACSFAKVGLVPDTGSCHVLTARIGAGRARLLMLLGEPVDAATAERYGLVEILTEPGQALAEAIAIATRMALNAPLSHAFTKALMARLPCSLDTILSAEADSQGVLFTTADFAEGRAAALAKRPPNFTGS